MLRVEANTESRLENEERLSGYQRKKGAIIFGSAPKDLRTGTPVAYKVISGVEEREIDDIVEVRNEDGEIERVKKMKVIQVENNTWAFGSIDGMQAAIDERGLHGNGYSVLGNEGLAVSVPRHALITEEMHDHIKYKPTLLLLYQNDEPILVVFYTWDSTYLPCPLLKEFVPGLLDDKFVKFIDKQSGYEVSDDHKLTVSVTDANKNVHKFGPMTCSLFQNSDCRGCLTRLLNFSNSGWNNTRNLAKSLCGRGTMYADGNFVIRRYVSRELFIRFIEVEKWAKHRGGKYLLNLAEAILEFQDEYGVGLPEYQLNPLTDIIKAKIKEEYAAIKNAGDKAELDAYKLIKKQLNASLKKIKSYREMDVGVEEGEAETEIEIE